MWTYRFLRNVIRIVGDPISLFEIHHGQLGRRLYDK